MTDNKSIKHWEDKEVRPTMLEVCITVCWYAIDNQPNWQSFFSARKSRVINKGTQYNVYQTINFIKELDIIWYNNIWEKYVGEKMPYISENNGSICRPHTIFDYPKDLIEVLKKYAKDSRTKTFIYSNDKYYVETYNKLRDSNEEIKIDPNPELKEISEMIMLFKTKQEVQEWIKEVMHEVKGFTPKQIEKNKTQHSRY